MLIENKAYVLRSTKYGERDLIVELFVKGFGKLSAIAKSAKTSKRRFPGGLEFFSKMQIRAKLLPNRNLATLEETTIYDGHPGIRTSFDKITVAAYVTELSAAMVQPEEEADVLFNRFDRVFSEIEKTNDDGLPFLLLQYELYLAQILGYAPSLEACFKCGKSYQNFEKYRVSRTGEGLVCKSCKEGELYGVAELDTMRVFWGKYREAIIAFSHVSQARRIVWASLGPVLDRELKTRCQVDALWTANEISK